MPIAQTQTTSFKKELYEAVHNFLTDTFKIALYTANANLDASTEAYTTTNEVTGTGYSAGGVTLTGVTVQKSGTVAFVSFSDVTWNPASFTARGALIYNSSKANRSVAVLDFGADKTATSQFQVQFPAATSTSAIIRTA